MSRNSTKIFHTRILHLHLRVKALGDGALDDGFAESVEGFELLLFRLHRPVNRLATRVQIRRNPLLLGEGWE